MGCNYHKHPCPEARLFLSYADIEKAVKKREEDDIPRNYIRQKGYQVVEMWEGERRSLYKTDASVKSHLRENFPYKRPLSEKQLLQGIMNGKFFG